MTFFAVRITKHSELDGDYRMLLRGSSLYAILYTARMRAVIYAERKRGRYPLKGNTKHLSAVIFVFTVIAIAYACRMMAKFDIGGPVMNHIRTVLYLLLFALWGFPLTGASSSGRRCTACG